QMSSPNSSIANLSVTRKSLNAGARMKPLTRNSGCPFLFLFPRASESDDARIRRAANKKPALDKRRRGSRRGFCCAAIGGEPLARLLLQACVSRGDRLQSVGSHPGVKFRTPRRLGDEALVSLPGEFRLNLDRRFDTASAQKLLPQSRV